MAHNPTGIGSVYQNGDTITINFNVATDQAGLVANIAQTRVVVDSLFIFSQLLGTDYVGVWQNSQMFVITIVDWPGASPPTVGPGGLVVTCRTDVGMSIRADPFTVGLSIASTSVSPVMTGDFGPQVVFISSIQAVNPTGSGDVYSSGDKLIILFNMYTNQGFTTINGNLALTMEQINNMFLFSSSLGASYVGTWDNLQQMTITVQNPTGSGPPAIGIFTVTCQSTGQLRNTPAACAPCTTTSPPLTGNWGPSNLTIVSITAADPSNMHTVYSNNDTITVLFNKDTDLAGFTLGSILTKSNVDSLFSFSASLGAAYIGEWTLRSQFIITAVDVTGSGPPAIGAFTLSVKASAMLRNYPPQSAPCTAISPPLVGNWGTITPKIVGFVAFGVNGIYSKGCTLTITFFPPTNIANLPQTGLTKGQINSILYFSQSLGSDYSAVWLGNTVLQVTIQDPTGAAPPVRGVVTVACLPYAPSAIRNADQISDPCNSVSPALSGDFGPSSIHISIIASGDSDPRYSAGDQISIMFSNDTNRAGMKTNINKTQVDYLLFFSQNIGSGHSGQWVSDAILVINITNTSGSAPPSIGTLTVRINAAAQLRNLPPNSAPLSANSSVLTGSFGPNNISIVSLVASDPLNANSIFSPGDIISVIFSENTNQGGYGSNIINKSQIDSFVNFSVSLGSNYQGLWSSPRVLQIISIATVGCGPPVLGVFRLIINSSSNIRNMPPTSSPLNAISPFLTGDFGPSPITIISFTAKDPTDLNDVYSVGDQLTIIFSQATDRAGLPITLTKMQVDSLLNFSQSLGEQYVGNWTTASQLVITVLNVIGSAPPTIGQTTVSVLQSAGLRNVPPQCKPTSVKSQPLSGNWGILFPHIIALVAQDPTNSNSVYSFLDTITLVFSIPTNQAGFAIGDIISRTTLLQMFAFSQQLGSAFTGEWVSSDTLVITIGGTSGASPPTIGGLFVTCKTNTVFLIVNELSTSRPCSSTSPALSGDFGPSSVAITTLVATDPSNVGGVYHNGDTITVNFNENTNQGGFPSANQAGGILNKSSVDEIFKFSAVVGKDYFGSWTTQSQFVIQVIDSTSAGPPIPGAFTVTILQGGNIRNFPPACAPSKAVSPFLSGNFGPSNISILSWVASYPPSFSSCQGYVAGSMMTVTFSVNTTRAGYQQSSNTKAQLDSLFNFYFILGTDYTGTWLNDATLVITIVNANGASPPTIGSVVASIQGSAGLKALPPVTAGSFATAPKMIGAFGPSNVHFDSVVASGTDSVFSNTASINIFFNIPTNKAFLPDSGISKSQINKLFLFSLNIGTLYSAAWISTMQLSISFTNASRDASNSLPYPPYVSTLRNPYSGLQLTLMASGELRNTPPLCAASSSVSPFLTGNFGPSKINITGLEASSTVAGSVYSKDDTITIVFSENTDQAGYSASDVLSKSDIAGLFNFSMNLGANYIGSWVLPNMFTITCQDSTGSSPPTIGGLQVVVVPGNNIRNTPPQSAPMVPAGFSGSPFLTGSFGPSDISIIAFNAYDSLDLSSLYHAGDCMAIVLNEHPSWNGRSVYNGQSVSQAEVDLMLSFSQKLGRSYQGQWIDLSVCPAEIYTNQPPFDGPPCVGIVITVTDITDAAPPQIGVLQVRFLETGNVRNDPPQSDVTTALSQPLSGNWGIPIPKILSFTAAPPANVLVQNYSDGTQFTLVFDEATDRAGLGSAWFGKTDVDMLLIFSQNIGANYRGKWTSTSILVIQITDTSGSTPPEIGILTVMVLSTAGLILRNAAQTSKPSTSRYLTDQNGVYGIQGSFSVPVVQIVHLSAQRSTYLNDYIWGPGDTITVQFNVVVNKGCYEGCGDQNLGMDYLSGLFSFEDLFWSPSVPILGSNFSGAWTSEYSEHCIRCTSGTFGVCKKDLDLSQSLSLQLMNSSCSALAVNSTICPIGYSLCNSKTLKITNLANYTYHRPPTIGGFFLLMKSGNNRSLSNYPASAGPLPYPSPDLTGDFGEACVQISNLIASDPINLDGNYGPGQEMMKVVFNQNVSLAQISAGQPASNWNITQLNELFEFFCLPGVPCLDFAQDYVGKWIGLNQLVITLNVSYDVYPFNLTADPNMVPWIGRFYLQVRNGTNLRNFPAACAPSTPVSPALIGSFGPSNLAIVDLEVQNPSNLDAVYGNGDIISATFSHDTDGSGKLNVPFTKGMIDLLFIFSRPLGLDYNGVWISRRVFSITVTQIGGVGPIDGRICCNETFTVHVSAAGNLRQFPPTSDVTSTCGGPQVCNQIGTPSSKFWGTCTFLKQNLSGICQKLQGNYGKPYPRIISLFGQGPNDGRSDYRSGVNISITFNQPVNLGACNSIDALEVICNLTLGTCSLPDLGTTGLSKSNCTNLHGIWLPGNGFLKPNCQLIGVNTTAQCAIYGGRWSSGISPCQACSDGSNSSQTDCLRRGLNWTIFDTRIPKVLVDRAMQFSDRLGTDYTGRWTNLNLSCILNGLPLVCSQVFVLDIINSSLAGPPEMDLFYITLVASEGIAIRSAIMESQGSTAISPLLTGSFGPSVVEIYYFVAGPPQYPVQVPGLYQNGVSLLIGFNTYTNRANMNYFNNTKNSIDVFLSFDKSIGSNYTGFWTNCTTAPGKTLKGCQSFVINITDASGAAPPTVSGLVVTINQSASLRNYPASCAPASGYSGQISGDWGPSPVVIMNLVAENNNASFQGLYRGSAITLYFNMETNRGGIPLLSQLSMQEVKKMLTFQPGNFAQNFTAFWSDNKTFTINITETNSSFHGPYIGSFYVTILQGANIRNFPPTSAQTTVVSPPLSGGFGRSALYIVSLIANWYGYNDTTFSDNDTISIIFNQATDQGVSTHSSLNKTQIDSVFNFSSPLGTNYIGLWMTNTTFKITILNSEQAQIFSCEPKQDCIGSFCAHCLEIDNYVDCLKQMPDSASPDQILNLNTSDCPNCLHPVVCN